MATLPTVPSFTDTDSSLTKLQQLAYAVSFLSDGDVRPVWHTYGSSAQSLTANAWGGVNTANVAIDSDGVNSSPGATIVTRGYYAVEVCVPFEVGATSIGCGVAFRVVAGSSNPHHTGGTYQFFGLRESASTAESAVYTTLCSTELCPWVCYPGDQIIPMAWVTSAASLGYNNNTAYREGRFVRSFTGLWIRTGT